MLGSELGIGLEGMLGEEVDTFKAVEIAYGEGVQVKQSEGCNGFELGIVMAEYVEHMDFLAVDVRILLVEPQVYLKA